MHRQRFNPAFSVFTILVTACTPSGPRVLPVILPVPAEATDTTVASVRGYLRFQSGIFQYHLTQNTRIHVEGTADTTPNTITTSARLLAEISARSDSTYDVTLSIDSLHMSSEGAIPIRSMTGVSSLGPVLHASFRPSSTTIDVTLPDSLCAYSQFITAARELLLPEFSLQISLPLTRSPVDTTRMTSCRAGSRIKMVIVRQLKDLMRDPPELDLYERTQLQGAGVLGRDSVAVSGELITSGTLSFAGKSRLPSLLQSQSEGLITVRIGDSTTVFKQSSTQRIEQRQIPPPN